MLETQPAPLLTANRERTSTVTGPTERIAGGASTSVSYDRAAFDSIQAVLAWKIAREKGLATEPRPLTPAERARIAIDSVVDKGAKNSLSSDKETVAKVVQAVDTIRKTSDRAITDKEIYLAYRKLAEVENADPRVVRFCQILLDLMGGSTSGKLPF